MRTLDLPGTNGKATILTDGSIQTLFSYKTKVAEYNTATKQMQVFGYHSLTTGRHINRFFELQGLPIQTKKELFKNYNLTK